MRIALFAPGNFERPAGDVTRVLGIASALHRHGCEVTLIVPRGSRVLKADISNVLEFSAGKSRNLYLNYVLLLLSSSFLAQNTLKKLDFDVIQAEVSVLIWGTPLWNFLKKSPLVCDMHSIMSMDFAGMFLHPLVPAMCSLVASWQKSAVDASKGVIVVSRKMEDYVRQHWAIAMKRIAVIYNGVDTDLAREASHKFKVKYEWIKNLGEPIVGYVGCLERMEGVDVLVRAFYDFRQRNRRGLLVVAGGGTQEITLRKLVNSLGMKDKVIFLGWVPYEETFGLQENMDILVSPLKPQGFCDVAFPMKIPNYMISGKPVIASAVGDVPLVFEDSEDLIMVTPNNSKELVGALDLLVDDADLSKRLGMKARKKALEFDWNSMTKTLLKFYGDVLD